VLGKPRKSWRVYLPVETGSAFIAGISVAKRNQHFKLSPSTQTRETLEREVRAIWWAHLAALTYSALTTSDPVRCFVLGFSSHELIDRIKYPLVAKRLQVAKQTALGRKKKKIRPLRAILTRAYLRLDRPQPKEFMKSLRAERKTRLLERCAEQEPEIDLSDFVTEGNYLHYREAGEVKKTSFANLRNLLSKIRKSLD
jgi:hypothetical protein